MIHIIQLCVIFVSATIGIFSFLHLAVLVARGGRPTSNKDVQNEGYIAALSLAVLITALKI